MSFKKIVLISSIIGIVIGGGAIWLGQSMREVTILHTDTELVNCIEEKFDNGEFEQNYSDGMFYVGSVPWVSDSLEIFEDEEYRLVNERLNIVDVAVVKFGNQIVKISDHESDRILEIIKTYEAEQYSILQIELDKEQVIVREKLNQYCKK